MATKYYTRFLLRSVEQGYADEYSGIVEVAQGVNQVLEPREIEVLLARNFRMPAEDIELLNWSRLH